MVSLTVQSDVLRLVKFLLHEPKENQWIEFKRDNDNPEVIGKYVSALANSAAIHEKQFGYLIWGVDDKTREVIGTKVNPLEKRVANQDFLMWLEIMTGKHALVEIGECELEGLRVVIMRVRRAVENPVRFKKVSYVRVGQATPELSEHPQLESKLWQSFQSVSFENLVACERETATGVLKLLHEVAFASLHRIPLPTSRDGKLDMLRRYGVIQRSEAGGWDIFKFGALLYARDISAFPDLSRKALRVIRYVGSNRTATQSEQVGRLGYAIAFTRVVDYVHGLLPRESIGRALRKDENLYPDIAIRELLANTLIHQDFTIRGAGPLLEVFDERIEFTNPGLPLIETDRFIDAPARSRNEMLARHMREIGICEERGSGVDKVVTATEVHQLPSPNFEVTSGSTIATLFAPKALSDMSSEERVRACYMHACLRHVEHDFLTNSSLRTRFQLPDSDGAVVSRVINEALAADKIKLYDPSVGYRARKYSPYWA